MFVSAYQTVTHFCTIIFSYSRNWYNAADLCIGSRHSCHTNWENDNYNNAHDGTRKEYKLFAYKADWCINHHNDPCWGFRYSIDVFVTPVATRSKENILYKLERSQGQCHSKGIVSGVCILNMKSLYLTVQVVIDQVKFNDRRTHRQPGLKQYAIDTIDTGA